MSASPVPDGLWLRRHTPAREATRRVVCFPHAGGSASFFHPLARVAAPGVEVVAVQYPGRQDRLGEPCVEDLETLADHVHDALARRDDGVPTVLFGHSMGALVAFEVARRLGRAALSRPARLVVSGRRAPSVVREETVHLLDDDGLAAEVARLGGTDPRLLADQEIRDLVLPAVRGDYRAVETYRHEPGEPLSCPVTVLTGDTDPRVTEAEARGWEPYTRGPFALRVFPGGHFFLNNRWPEVMELLAEPLGTGPEATR